MYTYIYIYIDMYIYIVSPRPKGTFCGDYRSQSLNAKPTFPWVKGHAPDILDQRDSTVRSTMVKISHGWWCS